MASHNRVILLGNVTRDIEVKYLQSGTAVTEMGMAVNDRRKNQQGEWVDEVTFVDVTLWGRTAEIAGEYLSKGSPVFIEGRLKLDTWEKDGKKNYKLRVVGERLQLLGSRQGGGGSGRGSQGSQPAYDESEFAEPEPASAPRGSAPPRTPPAAPPPGDDIPF
ncbi:MAG TPA: single-stranded DNA-binding protein [Pirellulaceae bacterium]|jgi:single-strand DNA-binding protein|nr:single-stranded DNA-binding protein [Pirellulaceae bacterium]